jgi:hypothetical protein
MSDGRPTLFISHSSLESELAKRLIAELRVRVQEKLEVLLDAEVLDGGQRWRDELWTWWSECDAAVVICSEAALQSRWVMIEVSILMRRKRINAAFPILPLLVHPVVPGDLKQSLFHDQNLEELQVTSFADDARFDAELDELAEKLAALEVLNVGGKPLIVWELTLAALLEETRDANTLAAAAKALGAKAETWGGISLQARLVARALLECGDRAKITAAVSTLAPRLREKVRDVVDLVAPAWLTSDEVAPVESVVQRPRGSRGVALASRVKSVARWYVQRGTRRHRAKPIEFPMPTTTRPVEEMMTHIRAGIRHYLEVEEGMDDAVARSLLEEMEDAREPVFLLAPVDATVRPDCLDPELLEALMQKVQEEFPTLCFFCLAGDARASLAAAEARGRLVFVPHDKDRETQLSVSYLKLKKLA